MDKKDAILCMVQRSHFIDPEVKAHIYEHIDTFEPATLSLLWEYLHSEWSRIVALLRDLKDTETIEFHDIRASIFATQKQRITLKEQREIDQDTQELESLMLALE